MGSSGNGRFGDYKPDKSSEKNQRGMGQGIIKGIGSGGEIECPTEIPMIRLEDVAISDYYQNHHDLPQKGEDIYLNPQIHNGRLVVMSSDTQEIVGNLPTKYYYLINCLKAGKCYSGTVVFSDLQPVPSVVVTLYA